MSSENLIICLLFYGSIFFICGVHWISVRRKAIHLITSKTRSVAMGAVELSGFVGSHLNLTDPIYKKPCAYYNIKVQEYSSGGSGKWVTTHEDKSDGVFFFCRDKTGQVMIMPKDPDLFLVSQIFPDASLNFTKRLESNYLLRFTKKLNSRLLFTILHEGDPLYVLGCALPSDQISVAIDASGPPPTNYEIANMLKKDAERMKALDSNSDGHVDAAEWEKGMREYKQFLEAKKLKAQEALGGQKPDVLEFSGFVTSTPDTKLIFAHSEKKLMDKLNLFRLYAILGGAAFILGLILLLQKLI